MNYHHLIKKGGKTIMSKPKKLLSKDIKDFSLSEIRKLGSEMFKEMTIRENNTIQERVNEYCKLIDATQMQIKDLMKKLN